MGKFLKNLEPSERLLPLKNRKSTPQHPLKEFFRERGITQAQVATALEITQARVSQFLSGRHPVPYDTEKELQKIAERIRSWEKRHGRPYGT